MKADEAAPFSSQVLAPVDAAEPRRGGARVRHRGREYEALKATLRDALLAVLDQFPARGRGCVAESARRSRRTSTSARSRRGPRARPRRRARSPAARALSTPTRACRGPCRRRTSTNGVAGAYLSAILATSHVSKLALLRPRPSRGRRRAVRGRGARRALRGVPRPGALARLGRAPPRAKAAEAPASGPGGRRRVLFSRFFLFLPVADFYSHAAAAHVARAERAPEMHPPMHTHSSAARARHLYGERRSRVARPDISLPTKKQTRRARARRFQPPLGYPRR